MAAGRSLMGTAGLTVWLPFKADSFVTEVETSGLKSVVSDLLVRSLTSFTCVEIPEVIELWPSEAVLWVFTVFDKCSSVTVMSGLLTVPEGPGGFCVDE